MVQSARLYTLESTVSFDELYGKLRNIDLIEERRINGDVFKLRTLVREASLESDKRLLRGTLLFENLQPLPQLDGTLKFSTFADRIDFVFVLSSPPSFFIPFGNQFESETAATKMNNALFDGRPIILNYFLPTRVVEDFLLKNQHIIKRCTWKDLKIPGINKVTLGGPDIMLSPDHRRYDNLGLKKYIMVELRENGWVIGLSDLGSLIFYTNVEKQTIIEFIKRKIIPLIIQKSSSKT